MAMISNLSFLVALTALRVRQHVQQRAQADKFRRSIVARESELNAVMTYMQTVTEEEKSRMARGLHDELGGVLTSAKIDIGWIRRATDSTDPELVQRLERLSKALDEAVNIERRVVETLRPSLLDHLGLGAALDWYVTDACKAASIDCSRKSFDEAAAIPPDLAIVVYRVVQEALSNIVSHAEAQKIEISLERDEEGLHLCLIHDGSGPRAADAEAHRQRLALMRQRTLGLGGSLEIDRPKGTGTRLRAFFPAASTA